MPRRDSLTPYRQTRRQLYQIARLMGDLQPFLELSPRRILRRYIHRFIGRAAGEFLFGVGGAGRLIRRILGL